MKDCTITVGADPGKHHAGWSIFIDGVYVKGGATFVKPEPNTHGPEYRNPRFRQGESQSAARVAMIIAQHVNTLVEYIQRQGVTVRVEYIAEVPHVYVDEDRKLQKGSNPVALFPLALTSATIGGVLHVMTACRIRYVEPGEWKGNRSDEATWAWLRKSMRPTEVQIAQQCGVYDEASGGKSFHHGLEAYGIGAWSVFRV